MAYSGLPSRACANCRVRRIKCNLLVPACSQCRRAGKECPGYRDELSLLFRDENSKVIRKAHARTYVPEQQKTRHRGAGTPNTPIGDSDRPWTTSPTAKPDSPRSDLSVRTFSLPLEDLGINFFFHHYFTSSLPVPTTPLDISAWPFWKDVLVHQPFLEAVSSVGLAGLANVRNNRQLMRVARLKYASTLHRVVNALQNPASADLSYTLKAVMMLALFELVDYSPESAGSWRVHVGGAIALVSSGHFQQLQDLADARVKIQFCFSILVNCIDVAQRLPRPITLWSCLWGASLSREDAPAGALVAIIIRFVELNASIKAGILTIPSAIYQEALQLDVALKEWRRNLPAVWKYSVASSPSKSALAFNGQYHVYQDFWIERMWDHYRWVRILVRELLLTQSENPPSSREQMIQQAESLQIIPQLASDICTSVATVLYRLAPPSNTNNAAPRVGGVFVVLWILRVAGSAIGTSDALHDWVIQMLENIGQKMGILQTEFAISVARKHRERWKRQFPLLFDGSPDDLVRDVDALSDFTDLD